MGDVVKKLALSLICVLALAAGAAADPTPDSAADAKRLYQEGNTHFNLGEYDKAAENFKEAYRLSKKPLLLYNVAQAYRLGHEPDKALTFYKNFLNSMPDAENRAEVEQYIKDLEALVASQDATAKKPPTGTVAPDEHVKIPPPDKAVTGPSGPSGPSVPEERHDQGRPIYKKWWFWAGIGAVAVGATVAVVAASGGGKSAPTGSLGTTPIF
jgi:tetratricopeptide (TPR) repeat protein